MESVTSSSSSGTMSTALTISTKTMATTQDLSSGMATSSTSSRTSDTISDTTTTTSTTRTMSTFSSSTSSVTSTSTSTTSSTSNSPSTTTTTPSTTSKSTSSAIIFSSTSIPPSSSTSLPSTPTSSTTTISTPLTPPKTTTSTDNPVSTPTSTSAVATVITTILTSTGSNGNVVTITQVQVNPTLSPNNNDSTNSTFFSNTGAVAGTFILVGLTAASILLWIFFYIRRRRRRRQLEYDSAVSATLAAAGLYRTPLDDDDLRDDAKRSPSGASPIDMNQRSGSRMGLATMHSQPSNGRISAYNDGPDPDPEAQNPFAEFGVARPDGYIPARTSSPDAHYARDRQGSTSTGGFVKGHSANQSVGSYEPLLASYNRRPSNPTPPSPTVPLQLLVPVADQNATAGPSTGKPLESTNIDNPKGTDDRLDPNIRQRLENSGDNASAKELRDEEDYSRPVLQVRNLPDTDSRES